MSLETLLQAAEFVESSSGPNTKENPSNARATGNISSNVFVDRRRVVSESDATERRRRPGGAGTRETHNKLEKNRRAHLKECFDILKKQVPTLEEKKTSNLNILRSALKYIQTMKNQEQDYVTEVDFLKTNKQNLLERLGALKSKTKVEQKAPCSSSTASENGKASSDSKKTNCLLSDDLDSRIPPISVATQTIPNLDKDATPSSVRELEEVSNTCVSTSSSTDTGIEGDESDRKTSTCEDDDDEKTDTDEELNDDDNDSEIDVVGPDDSSSNDSLHIAVENTINGEIEVEKKKASSETRGRNASKSTRKRSKSEMKCEEDSDYDENTKEEPKAKIQACARVSV